MSSPDDQLNRLFRAASGHPGEEIAAPAFGLETRVLAAWRSSRSASASVWDTAVLVRGLALAGLIMALSILPALNEKSVNSDTENLQLADSSVQTDWSP
jgi:hypothetical protein